MTGFLDITRVQLPRSAIRQVHEHLQSVGQQGYEGLGIFVGRRRQNEFHVTQGYIPRQHLFRSALGVGLSIPAFTLHELNVWLYEHDLSIIAQVHSHPTIAYHSDTDDEFPIATVAGAFSIVVPDFAQQPFSLRACGVYRLTATARWDEISLGEVARIFVITD